jgi:hypothetical protein
MRHRILIKIHLRTGITESKSIHKGLPFIMQVYILGVLFFDSHQPHIFRIGTNSGQKARPELVDATSSTHLTALANLQDATLPTFFRLSRRSPRAIIAWDPY